MKYALLLFAMLALPAQAQMITGNRLHEEMQKPNSDNIAWAFTRGYVAGVHDSQTGISICAPSTSNLGQMSEMVKNYLENTPSVRHFSADSLVFYVLKTTWPCAKKGTAL